MTISDKTRKLLWGRSGSRCAYCKCEIIMDATSIDDESVVGDECHIVTKKPNGPRYAPDLPEVKLDSYDNLLLLCCVHHKMVDDQEATYTPEILRQIKADHERWVSQKLAGDETKQKGVRIRRIRKNIPKYLIRLTTGKEVFEIVDGAYAFSTDHDELQSEHEVELIGDFLQTVSDWGDLGLELEPGDRVRVSFQLTQLVKGLEDAGFLVFGAREVQVLEGGDSPPVDWPVAILRVVRSTNEEIVRVSWDEPDSRED